MEVTEIINKFKHPLLLDGAMGTEILQRMPSPPGSTCAVNITHPEIVSAIHRDYIHAGAQILFSNSFMAHRKHLKEVGLEKKIKSINQAAIELAKEQATANTLVAASLGARRNPLKDKNTDVFDLYQEQLEYILPHAPDCFVFETISHPQEIEIVLRVTEKLKIQERSLLSISPHQENNLVESLAELTKNLPLLAIGCNCGMGPKNILESIEALAKKTEHLLLAKPNFFGDESLNPTNFTQWGQQALQKGATLIGGCCQTTPAHILALHKSGLFTHQ